VVDQLPADIVRVALRAQVLPGRTQATEIFQLPTRRAAA
jgi:hypothetical protein